VDAGGAGRPAGRRRGPRRRRPPPRATRARPRSHPRRGGEAERAGPVASFTFGPPELSEVFLQAVAAR
jgi:hypothetical protein